MLRKVKVCVINEAMKCSVYVVVSLSYFGITIIGRCAFLVSFRGGVNVKVVEFIFVPARRFDVIYMFVYSVITPQVKKPTPSRRLYCQDD